jgi:uncharacterized OB-fold protein
MLAFKPVVKPYYDALTEGKILGAKCNDCGMVSWPPYPFCQNPECTSDNVEWVQMSGEAVANTIQQIATPFAIPNIKHFRPYLKINGTTSEGSEFDGILQGYGAKDYEDLKSLMPLKIKAQIIDFDENVKTVVWKVADTRYVKSTPDEKADQVDNDIWEVFKKE